MIRRETGRGVEVDTATAKGPRKRILGEIKRKFPIISYAVELASGSCDHCDSGARHQRGPVRGDYSRRLVPQHNLSQLFFGL